MFIDFSPGKERNIFCIMHERYDAAQIVPKTNSLVINVVASRVCVVHIGPPRTYDRLPHRQMEGGRDKKAKHCPVRRG